MSTNDTEDPLALTKICAQRIKEHRKLIDDAKAKILKVLGTNKYRNERDEWGKRYSIRDLMFKWYKVHYQITSEAARELESEGKIYLDKDYRYQLKNLALA